MQVEDIDVEEFDLKDIPFTNDPFLNDPIQRYSFLKNKIKTTPYEQKHNSEILTPDYIVDEMIQKLIQLFSLEQIKKWKIIEPCCGKGAFLIGLYKVGVPVENLFWNDFNQNNVSFCNLLFNQNKGTCQDALKIDYSKYDLVITNPPYNCGKKSIYQSFVNKFQTASHQMVLIPSKCLVQKTNSLQEVLNTSYISNEFNSRLFGQSVEIVVFYLISNVQKQFVNYKLPKYNFQIEIIQPTLNVLKEELVFKEGEVVKDSNLTKIFLSSYYSKLEGKQTTADQKILTYRYAYLKTQSLQNTQIQNTQIQKQQCWKVCLIHKVRSTFNWLVMKPDELCNNSFIGIKCSSQQQAKSLQTILMKDELQNEIKKLSYSQRNITKEILQILFMNDELQKILE